MKDQVDILQVLQPVLATMAEAALASGDGTAAQVWLTGPGDICASCPRRADCPDQAACLHLAATAGDLDAAAAPSPRLPLGTGPIGRLPTAAEPLVAREGLAELGVADAAWLRRAGIETVVALPLQHGHRGLGALVVFAAARPSDSRLRAMAGAARLGAEAIGNVDAYRTLAAERNRLAAKNARLRSGLGLPEEPEPAPPPAFAYPVAAPPAPAPPAPAPPAPAPPAPAAASPPTPAPRPAAGPPAREAAEVLAATGAMLHSDRFELPPLRSFAQIQREGILHALERTGWRVSGPRGAAAALGVKPTTLESKMKKLGIRRPAR